MSSQESTVTRLKLNSTLWDYLALPDDELERTDLVAINIAVAKGIEVLKDLNVDRYVRIVDDWTDQFRHWLPGAEARFHQSPEKWGNDIRFFRVGHLQGFLGHMIGLDYVEERKQNNGIGTYYTNPSELFLNGLIDTKQGTCASMPVLHAAMARRMGWPVAIACANSHHFSRFDDGEVTHNIESTTHHAGAFSSGSDETYIKRLNISKKAIECGSDMRKLTAREMIAVFIGFRGRHYADIGRVDLADREFALARALFPNHRGSYVRGMIPFIRHCERLFNPNEVGHPKMLARDLASLIVEQPEHGATGGEDVEYIFAPARRPTPTKAPTSAVFIMPQSGTLESKV